MEPNPILEAGLMAGRQQAFGMIACKCTYAQAVCLRQIHQSRGYEHFGLSWEEFCSQQAGVSRATAERIIQRLDEFGEAYFRLSAITRISPDAFRQIADRVTAETVELDGEQIPLVSENAQIIRAGVQRLRDECRRLHDQFRVPTKIVEYSIRIDDVIKEVTARAKIARALPKDELAGLRALTRHALDQWAEIARILEVG